VKEEVQAPGERTWNEFANEIAASRDFIGLQIAENSPQSWYKKAGQITRSFFVGSLREPGTKTLAGQSTSQTFASKIRVAFEPYNLTPRKVPSVFVRRSVVPEFRVGRYDCRTSIVRLTANPITVMAKVARVVGHRDDQ
jgi:hypothetical protein